MTHDAVDPRLVARPVPVPTDYRGGDYSDFLQAINTNYDPQ